MSAVLPAAPRPRCQRCALPVPAGVTACGACLLTCPEHAIVVGQNAVTPQRGSRSATARTASASPHMGQCGVPIVANSMRK